MLLVPNSWHVLRKVGDGSSLAAAPGRGQFEPAVAASDEGCGRSRHPDELLVHELTDAEIGKLAAVARVLDAAEGQVGRGPARLVDKHHAGVDLPGDALAAFDVVGDNRSA